MTRQEKQGADVMTNQGEKFNANNRDRICDSSAGAGLGSSSEPAVNAPAKCQSCDSPYQEQRWEVTIQGESTSCPDDWHRQREGPTYIAPNADHIPDGLIDRRVLYRQIERMAGMTVPQIDYDCVGDPIYRPDPKPAEIFASILKMVATFQRAIKTAS